jgi:predicted N-formylglutamate amidohydrolase
VQRSLLGFLFGKMKAIVNAKQWRNLFIHTGRRAVFVAFKPFEIIKSNEINGLVLIADHAGRALPQEYGSLGLSPEHFDRHIAFDIGVEALTRQLARLLDAPAVLANFSRLLIDANRNEDDPTLIRQIYDRTIIPGNLGIDANERKHRLNSFFRPYQTAVRDTIDQVWAGLNKPPLIVSLHSFTPRLASGAPRPWHIGLLSDNDRRATDVLLTGLSSQADLIIGDNEPYDGALKGDTLYMQASKRGLPHVLIEVRQDLIADEAGAKDWAARLAPHIKALNARVDMHEIRFFGSRAGGLERTEP